MEVILRQDYPALGYTGETVKVKRGYARNYLIPRGIAVESRSRNARVLTHMLTGINAHKAKLKVAAEEIAAKLREVTLEFTLKLGEQGKSFGSVSTRDMEIALQNLGFQIDRKQIRLHEPIKSGGTFEAHVKLHSEISAPLAIKVTVDVTKPKHAAGDEEPHKERRRSKGKGKSAEESETAPETAELAAQPHEKASDKPRGAKAKGEKKEKKQK